MKSADLLTACTNGDTETVKLLIGAGIDAQQMAPHCLLQASYYGYAEIVRILLSIYSINQKDLSSALFWANNQDYSNVVSLILKHNRSRLFI
jgi:ankyrin repeat protein